MHSKTEGDHEVLPGSGASTATMLRNLLSAQGMEHIFKAQVLRAISLSANFSDITDSALSLLENQLISQVPTAEYSQISPALIGLFFDPGRANSRTVYSSALFQDPYHREAFFSEKPFTSLTEMGCVNSIPDRPCVSITVFSDLLPLVCHYFDARKIGYRIFNYDMPLRHLGCTEKICLLLVHTVNMKQALHSIGMLGAFPNRDLQLKYYMKCFKNPKHMRDTFLNLMATLYGEKRPGNDLEIKDTLHVLGAPQEIKDNTLGLLHAQARNYLPGIMPEQRLFYSQLLSKLIASFELDPNNRNMEHRIQSTLALSRIQTMLQTLNNLSYVSFLRTIEACIDEVIILLIIQHIQKPNTSLEIANSVKQFITDTVGTEPQIATLRSSAMQAIWSSLKMALDFFEMQTRSQALNVYISEATYFEVTQVLRVLFKIPNFEVEKEVSFQLKSDFTSEKLEDSNTIYDLYIGNFEGNVLYKRNQPQFSDINYFIANQLDLRKTSGSTTLRPLIVILDNTSSNVYEVYLPFLLQQFKEEINAGVLCTLVAYSGNKFLQLGTDKVLAGLLYGFYNPTVFSSIHECIHQELTANRLGDFDPNSPTVLLTQSYINHARNEILSFGPLLRMRTYYLFQSAIPSDLVNNLGYYTIDMPLSNVRYRLSSPKDIALERSSCFITIKCHSQNYRTFADPNNIDIHSIILDRLILTLASLGVISRDGFGFNQTTQTDFKIGNFPRVVRISIGTESFEWLSFALQKVCEYLQQINHIMQEHKLDKDHVTNSPLQAHSLFRQINACCPLPNTASTASHPM